jgi:hypothetical protein
VALDALLQRAHLLTVPRILRLELVQLGEQAVDDVMVLEGIAHGLPGRLARSLITAG